MIPYRQGKSEFTFYTSTQAISTGEKKSRWEVAFKRALLLSNFGEIAFIIFAFFFVKETPCTSLISQKIRKG